MKIVATVAEYNPLHTGHLYHIERAKRELNPDAFVVVMSGNFTQRGDIAIIEKHKRAACAIKAGADIVIELPFIYAVNCAEKFADGAMKTLSCINSPLTITFGSECGDVEKLKELSAKAHDESAEATAIIRQKLDEGERLVKARAAAIDGGDLFSPNNILGIEYVRAAAIYGYDCHTVKREGDYNGDETNGEYASANAIRNSIFNGKIDDVSRFLPDYVISELKNCISNDALSDMLLYKILAEDTSWLKNLNEVTEGLENRVFAAAKKSKNYQQLCENIKSKRYTMARIKRILLYALTNLTRADAQILYNAPAYARVLAIKKGKENLLSILDNPITKYSEISRLPSAAQAVIAFDNRADDIYAVASKSSSDFNTVFIDR